MDPQKDLPLMANTANVRVRHYVLNLSVSFEKKTLSGSVTLFLESATENEAKEGVHALKDEEDFKGTTPTKRARKNSASSKGAKRLRSQSTDPATASNLLNDALISSLLHRGFVTTLHDD